MEAEDRVTMNVVLRAFGALEGTVASMATQWREQEKSASAGRRVLYEKLEAFGRIQIENQAMLKSVEQGIAEIKHQIDTDIMPTVNTYLADKHRREGAGDFKKWLWTGVGTLLGAGVAALGYVTKLFGLFGGGPPR